MGRTRIAAVLLAASVAVVACGDDDDSSSVTVPADETSSTPTSERETTTTTEDPTAAVEQAFYDQWDAYVELGAAPDPEAPLIDDIFTGSARESVADGISRLLAEGNAVRLPEDSDSFRPSVNRIEIVDPTTAILFECTLDGLVVFNPVTGQVVDDSVDEIASRNTFRFVDGRWKLAEISALQAGDPTCDF